MTTGRPEAPPDVVLGVVDGLHDAGAAVVVGGRLVAAANEERFTRRKLQGGMPHRSIDAVLAIAGLTPRDVDAVAVGGLATPTVATRLVRPLQSLFVRSLGICFDRPWHPVDRLGDLVRYRLPLTRSRSGGGGRLEKAVAAPALRRSLRHGLGRLPVHFVDHHLAHAESAWRTAGPGDWLVVTADAHGDGRSLAVWEAGEDDPAPRLALEVGVHQSVGAFYSRVTRLLGFTPGRHEGKVLGLSARGDAEAIERVFPFTWVGQTVVHTGRWGLRGARDLAPLAAHRREDVAAWVQRGTEAVLLPLIEAHRARTGARRVALAGGVFANVVLNGRLALHPGVQDLHVFPHMGDGGLAAGAALHLAQATPTPLTDAYLGPDLDAAAMDAALARVHGARISRPEEPEEILRRHLEAGRPVARCVGRMEFGPRALGHRSVLAPAHDPGVLADLGRALRRDEFMPFAPLVRAEDAAACFAGVESAGAALRFMTVALPVTAAFARSCPAVVHVDDTARPQVLDARTDPALHRMLTRHAEATGRPAVVNTSFNLHEEPIVGSPADAVRAFHQSGLACLQLGPWIVERRRGGGGG